MKQQKKGSNKLKLWLYALLAVLPLLPLGWLAISKHGKAKDLPTQMKYLSEVQNPRALKEQVWYTPTFRLSQLPNGGINAEAQTWTTNRWNQIKYRLDAYPQDNIRSQAAIFAQSIPAAVTAGPTPLNLGLVNNLGRPATTPELRGRLKITFYGAQQVQNDLKGVIEGPLAYKPELDIIFVAAYEQIEPVMMDAMIFHELTHAQQTRRATAFGATIPNVSEKGRLTDLGADNEIEAHEVGRQVFETGTKGQYGQRITKVMADKGKVDNPIKLMLEITPKDLNWIDETLGRPALFEGMYRRFQYFYDLGREWINLHVPEPDRKSAIREFFRTLSSAQPQ